MMYDDILGNRRTIRIKTNIGAVVSDQEYNGHTIDLSIDACRLAIQRELSKDQVYDVILKLPERDVNVKCSCIRSKHKDDNCEAVLSFIDPSPSFVDHIEGYIKTTLGNIENAISRQSI